MPKRDEPVEQFIKDASTFTTEQQARYKELKGRAGREQELLNQYWKDPGPHTMEPLLKSYEPVINTEVNRQFQGLGGSTPKAVIKNELMRSTQRQLETYKPDQGAKPMTWVRQGFRRTTDTLAGNRNAKYIPPADAKKWQQFSNAHQEFKEEHGRDPTLPEIKVKLGPKWTDNRIRTLQKGIGKELYTDMGDGLSVNEDHARVDLRQAYLLKRSRLSEEEKQVGEMWFPRAGEQRPHVKNIAKTLNISEPKAYRIIANVESKVGPEYRKG